MDAELLRLRERVLAAKAAGTPLRLRGAGTKDFYGESLIGELLDVSRYRGIVDYEPSELVITARCGTRLAEIEATLAERGQFLGFEPPRLGGNSVASSLVTMRARGAAARGGADGGGADGGGADGDGADGGGAATIGGVIATGLSGPRRLQAGAARDFVLGATLLSADGELLRFGGQVMKNVAGFDVSRLLCGSLGILGILTEVSIKVLPTPRVEETVCLEMTEQQALDAFNRWAGKPLPISAAAWHEGHAWLRLSGAGAAVVAARETIGGERVSALQAAQWWDALRDYKHPIFGRSLVWRVSVPSTTPALPIAGEPPGALTGPPPTRAKVLIDWGGALRWYAGDLQNCDVRGLAAQAGGTAMRWRGEGTGSRFHPLAPAVATLHRRLKQSFDPAGLFNRGRLLTDL